MTFSVGVLLYGDYPWLARRCLESLLPFTEMSHKPVVDFRVGLNRVSTQTRQYALEWAERASKLWRAPVWLYEPEWTADMPTFKYPVLRRMLYDSSAERFMWFDDDSYREELVEDAWWESLDTAMFWTEMVGAVYHRQFKPGQREWLESQPWCRFPPVARTEMRFVTGGWWVARPDVLKELDWPWPQLRHCGGDSMLGEALECFDCRIDDYRPHVRINADEQGRESRSVRRGFSEAEFAEGYPEVPWSYVEHQKVKIRKWKIQ